MPQAGEPQQTGLYDREGHGMTSVSCAPWLTLYAYPWAARRYTQQRHTMYSIR